MAKLRICFLLVLSMLAVGSPVPATQAQQGNGGGQYFPQTGHSIDGRFLQYWQQHGGLAQQGYPLSAEIQEKSPADGKVYTVQYFERAVFEMHPQNQQPNDVLLSLLGAFRYKSRYPVGAPNQKPNNSPGSVLFPQTGKRVGGSFLRYWQQNGALAQQGYPISDEFQEKSDLNGQTYIVQYFERAVFEYHPENKAPNDVLLSQLGTFQFRDRYLNPVPAIPALPNTSRGILTASDRYLVWSESSTGPHGSPADDTGDIWGFDLQTRKPISISVGEPNDQTAPDISGSLVVYETQPVANNEGDYRIVGKDLAAGEAFQVSTSTRPCRYPQIVGRSVLWLEFDEKAEYLMLRNLDSPAITTITTVPSSQTSHVTMEHWSISDDYVVWNEAASWDPRYGDPPRNSYIKVYNRKTGSIKAVAQYLTTFEQSGTEFALDGDRLAITGETPRVLDLNTGQSTPIKLKRPADFLMQGPSLKGNVLLWSSMSSDILDAQVNASSADSMDLWGINLADSNAQPALLVAGPGDQVSPIVSGGNLLWLDKEGPYSDGIGILPIDAVFATAPERLKSILP